MTMTAARTTLAVCVAAGLAAMIATGANADLPADYFKGKQVNLIVGYDPGGGYDVYARALGRHIDRYLPGQPSVVIRNMPGAASRQAANHLYTVAPKDGTSFGTIARGLPTDELLGAPGIRFESQKFTWIGSMNNEVSVGVTWHAAPTKTMDDAFKRETAVGGISDSIIFAHLMNDVLGTKFKIIAGYKGGTEISLAMERGEVEGRMGWSWSSIKNTNADWLRDKKLNILVQFSTSKHADLPNVPLVTELAKNDDDRLLLELAFARQVFGRPFIAPPEVAADVKTGLRKAFDGTLKDQAFLADAEKAKLEVNPVSGAEVEVLVSQLFRAPPKIIERAKAVIKTE
jgi:tripartite-type tricarboxylate transporter receptor subunit TctC